MYPKDSIAAIATGSASGGLGVIRISGTMSKDILAKVFLPKQGDNFCFRPRYMHYGSFVMANTLAGTQTSVMKASLRKTPVTGVSTMETPVGVSVTDAPLILDEVLAVYFPSPHSYTGEDVAEIHAHGGSALLHSMLEYIVSLGVRHAEAGEFTKRAFLNGRIDLSQAEAVAEIISAPAIEGVRLAAAKLHGVLGKRIEDLRAQIEYIRRRLCLAIDFPEEEGECLPPQEFHTLVDKLHTDISHLISAYDRAKPWSEGSLVVLAGQVNAGKSSLMNALLGRQRAIVTAEAGTTRDYLEEPSFLDGIPVRLTDTAGLREIAWLIEHSSQAEYGLSPQILERLSHVLHSDKIHFRVNKKNAKAENAKVKNSSVENINAEKEGVGLFTKKGINFIEAEGIRRSLELIERADLVFLVFDGTKLLERLNFAVINPVINPDCDKTFEQTSLIDKNREHANSIARAMQSELALLPKESKIICIWNKADIAPLGVDMAHAIEKIIGMPIFCISANPQFIFDKGTFKVQSDKSDALDSAIEKGFRHENARTQGETQGETQAGTQGKNACIQGIDDLARFARGILLKQESTSDEIAPNRRQAGLLQSARVELNFLKEEIDTLPPDLTAIRLESCAQYLSAITGLCSIDDTFNAIFEEFCIGK